MLDVGWRDLRYYSLRQRAEAVAGIWLACDALRFLVESMHAFRIGREAACLCDVFVHPDRRGQRVFRDLGDALEAGPFCRPTELWSCVDAAKPASRRAHIGSGFTERGWSAALTICDRVKWRGHDVPRNLPCGAFRPSL